jgi:hypothetical protein
MGHKKNFNPMLGTNITEQNIFELNKRYRFSFFHYTFYIATGENIGINDRSGFLRANLKSRLSLRAISDARY